MRIFTPRSSAAISRCAATESRAATETCALSRAAWGWAVSSSISASRTAPSMNVPMARSWNSVIGPRADDGERRHDCDSWPKARAHSDDSVRSSAPCWLIGDTTWEETVAGSTGT